jgi:hypothetical protein
VQGASTVKEVRGSEAVGDLDVHPAGYRLHQTIFVSNTSSSMSSTVKTRRQMHVSLLIERSTKTTFKVLADKSDSQVSGALYRKIDQLREWIHLDMVGEAFSIKEYKPINSTPDLHAPT